MATSMTRTRWAAIGAVVAISAGAGGFGMARATTPSNATAFIPITPCRLFDTRPGADNVGLRSTPLGPAETFTTQVTGSNGNCAIPATAKAVVMNITGVSPTAGTFVTAFPAGVSRPTAANLNLRVGDGPTPNLATVTLSADGKASFYNHAGTLHLIADITGYYLDHTHDERYYTKAQIDAKQPPIRLDSTLPMNDLTRTYSPIGTGANASTLGFPTLAWRAPRDCTITGTATFFGDITAGSWSMKFIVINTSNDTVFSPSLVGFDATSAPGLTRNLPQVPLLAGQRAYIYGQANVDLDFALHTSVAVNAVCT